MNMVFPVWYNLKASLGVFSIPVLPLTFLVVSLAFSSRVISAARRHYHLNY